MFRAILVPLDSSPEAEGVLPHVKRLAQAGGEIHLLHQIPFLALREGGHFSGTQRGQREAQAYLEGLRSRHLPGSRGLDLVGLGDPAEGILGQALEHEVDLIVLTTPSRPGFARPGFGSVGAEVLKRSPLPVLLNRAGNPCPTTPVHRILVAIDEVSTSGNQLESLQRLKDQTGAELILLQILASEWGPVVPWCHAMPTPVRSVTERRLQELATLLSEGGVKTSARTAIGDPVETILNESRACAADLIALGAPPQSESDHAWEGSVAAGLLRQSTIPILIQRPVESWKATVMGGLHV